MMHYMLQKPLLKKGIVPGGGVALLYATSGIKNSDTTGVQIVAIKACAKPFNQILVNAGYDRS